MSKNVFRLTFKASVTLPVALLPPLLQRKGQSFNVFHAFEHTFFGEDSFLVADLIPPNTGYKLKITQTVLTGMNVNQIKHIKTMNVLPFRAKTNSGQSCCVTVACLHRPHQSKETFHWPKASFHPANHKLHGATRGGGSLSCMCVRHAKARDKLVPQPAASSAHQERGVSLR